jgi:hypothetical protein
MKEFVIDSYGRENAWKLLNDLVKSLRPKIVNRKKPTGFETMFHTGGTYKNPNRINGRKKKKK